MTSKLYFTNDVIVGTEQMLEPTHSAPNLRARIPSRVPNFSMPNPLSVWTPTREEYMNATGAPLRSSVSTRTCSHSSSAEEAVHGDLPSPLDHISQEAAAYRSRVSSASRGVTRAQLAEVMRRIDLLENRRTSESTASSTLFGNEDAPVSPTYGATNSTVHDVPASPHGPLATDSIIDEPDSPFLPTTRHRRSLPKIRRVSGIREHPVTTASPSRSKHFHYILTFS
jgi:hypothetical protein